MNSKFTLSRYPLNVATLLLSLIISVAETSGQKPGRVSFRAALAKTTMSARWEAMLKEKKFDELVVETTAAIERNPTAAVAFRYRANAYRELGKRDLATKDYEEVIRLITKPVRADDHEALCAARTGLLQPWKQAIEACTAAIKLEPRRTSALLLRAGAYSRGGEYELAIKDHSSVIALEPKRAEAYSGRAFALRLSKRLAPALVDINEAIRLKPDEADFHHTLGLIKAESGDPDGSITAYSKAIELLPTFYFAYVNRASHYVDKNEIDLALADYTKAIDTWGGKMFADPYLERAKIYRLKRDRTKELADLTRAAEIESSNTTVFISRAALYVEADEYDKAVADLSRVIGLNPGIAEVWYLRGAIYYQKKIYDLALNDLSKAIELSSKNDAAHNLRGNVYFAKREFDLAVADYTTAAELNPKQAFLYLRHRAMARDAKGDKAGAAADQKHAADLADKLACSKDLKVNGGVPPGNAMGSVFHAASGAPIDVYVDGALVCKTASGAHCTYTVAPGRHFIIARKGNSQSNIAIDLVAYSHTAVVYGPSGLAVTLLCGVIGR